MKELHFEIKTFDELSKDELYKILRLRAEVFVVEQNCVYQDIDNKDQKALHLLGFKNQKLIAYTRLFDKGAYFDETSIGRVMVTENQRHFGYGHELIQKSIEGIENFFKTTTIKISAQCYLQAFYEKHGFHTIGEEYLEDGIPHIEMIKN